MKIAVASTGTDLDAQADPRFGRCAGFVVVDTDSMEFEALDNTAAMQGSGAGIAAAQLVADSGADAVAAGNFGPKAFQALAQGGLQTFAGAAGTVREVVEAFKAGQLQPAGEPTVAEKSGMGGGGGMAAGGGMRAGGDNGRERTTMKVAVAADGLEVADHFGRCEGYLIAEINDGQVGETEHVANPGHEPGRLPALLSSLGVECIVAGGMGQKAMGLFETYGITAIAGVQGSTESALARLAEGTLEGGESTCRHGAEHRPG